MKKVLILTLDEFLYEKISLELYGKFECVRQQNESTEADFTVVDLDSVRSTELGGSVITVSRSGKATVRRPFAIGEIERQIADISSEIPIIPEPDSRSVRISGKRIALTDVEYALFDSLYKRKGAFATRSELNEEVWGRESDGSLLNVYVHYLREKLEYNGEKVIISSRKNGYKIDERFFPREGGKTV